MNLWLDDMRDPVNFVTGEWLWVKTVDEAIAAMQLHNVQKASLDHDLGACDECMGPCPSPEDWLEQSGYKSMPHCSHVGTGYDLVLWMAEKGIWPAEKPTVHSANPVGRDRMRGVIDRYFPEVTEDGAE